MTKQPKPHQLQDPTAKTSILWTNILFGDYSPFLIFTLHCFSPPNRYIYIYIHSHSHNTIIQAEGSSSVRLHIDCICQVETPISISPNHQHSASSLHIDRILMDPARNSFILYNASFSRMILFGSSSISSSVSLSPTYTP